MEKGNVNVHDSGIGLTKLLGQGEWSGLLSYFFISSVFLASHTTIKSQRKTSWGTNPVKFFGWEAAVAKETTKWQCVILAAVLQE